MSAPKPGDRVKVSYEGTWNYDRRGGDTLGYVMDAHDTNRGVPVSATVEVLARPVYENSDTTEYRNGDVVRIYPSGAPMVYSADKWHYLSQLDIEATQPRSDETMTLLVRDGQVIA